MALLFTGIIHGSLVQERAVKRRANSRFGLTVTTLAPDYHKFQLPPGWAILPQQIFLNIKNVNVNASFILTQNDVRLP